MTHLFQALDTTEDASETEGSVVDDMDSPLWSLFTTVQTYTNNIGQVLSEPFNRLPNRKFYAAYYEEIDRPISLINIKTKLRVSQKLLDFKS